MNRYYLTDDQWEWVHQFLLSHPRVYVGNPERCRQFINAVLWMLRSGSQWGGLPTSYGNWNSIFKHYDRWADVGVWDDFIDGGECFSEFSGEVY